jgi:O-antigen ligase
MITFNKSKVKAHINLLNLVFVAHLVIAGLVVTGVLPRAVVPYWTAVLAVYLLAIPLEDSTAFFVRSIPFFIAIPLTANFDSLNMWRIFSGLIFLKWLLRKESLNKIWSVLSLAVMHHREFHKKYKVTTALLSLLILAMLSAIWAPNHTLAVKRIIYFVNLSLIGVVIYDLIGKNQDFGQRLIKNIAIPTIIVAVIGIIQLISTYYMDIFQFVDFWNGIVERNLFGNAWAAASLKANTWFAYFGDQLSLRMFSIFPDSHSFPIFLLLGLPAVMAIALKRVIERAKGSLRAMLGIRASMLVVFVPVIFLAMILTGTRGIWAAGGVITILAVIFIYWHRKKTGEHWATFKYVSSYLAIFFLLFGLAYYIVASNQFEVSKSDSALFAKRVRSLIDISETSNARRIQIWKDSARSIIKHPLLGVGIGNFPVVVGEDLIRAKAGSSAHNLYLHIAAEMGLPALITALWFLWLLVRKVYHNFLLATRYSLLAIYFASALIFIPWILIYSLTDVAITDERAFLLFVTMAAIIFAE